MALFIATGQGAWSAMAIVFTTPSMGTE
jgi:hypothetical protein